MKCNICPRECNKDRSVNEYGVCGETEEVSVARVGLHMWEEPCISGKEGSGTIFFTGCTLRCIYCQNYMISSHPDDSKSETHRIGKRISVIKLSDEFIKLQQLGANNINLVTPTHFSLQIKEAIILARKKGLNIPIVYNCSGYEKVETLKMLEDVVDIYLTDFKYMDSELARKYSSAEDYPAVCKEALAEMVRQKKTQTGTGDSIIQTGTGDFDSRGIMQKGIIVRVLLLPNHVKNAKEIVKYIYETYGDEVYISLMNQYTPVSNVKDIEDLNRKVTRREYDRLVDYALSLGINNAFIQEGDVADESFIPEWDY